MRFLTLSLVLLAACYATHAQQVGIEPQQPSHEGSLDQGGESCSSATVIPSLPYSDSGTLGTTNNCTGAPYRDVFYTYVATSAGAHTFDMCGTTGDTYMKVWMGGTCCAGSFYVAGDNECATSAPRVTVALEVGERCYIECGNRLSTAPQQSYMFHAERPAHPVPGDHCSGAFDYPGVPSTVSGNTCTFLDDYNESCDWLRFGGRDVVYRYFSPVDQIVTFSLCQSNFNTRLFVYETSCDTLPIACNDETPGCGPNGNASLIECLQMLAGRTYYIVIDGWDQAICGNYQLTSSDCAPCVVTCPPQAIPEGEPDCYEGYVDTYNGGCWATPSNFTPIECGQIYCGNFGTWSISSDFDWYRLEITTRSMVNWCVYAEYPAEAWIFSSPCNGNILATALGAACDTLCLSVCLNPGVYHLMVQPWHFGSTACPTPYFAWLTCTHCGGAFLCDCQNSLYTHCNTEGGNIPDRDTLSAPINVPVQYHITDVNVCLDIVHPYTSDLRLVLISPSGNSALLCNRRGADGDNFACTGFDDEAAVDINDGTPPFAGNFRPATPLSVFDGENAYGNWELLVIDVSDQDVGTFRGACLTFEFDRILPVALLNFAASEGDGQVALRWTTASESGDSRFQVMRDAVPVYTVQASGDPFGSHYAFTDTGLENGLTYTYTLVSIDGTGSSQEIGSLSATPHAPMVAEFDLQQNFPNPFNSNTTIRFSIPEQASVELVVFDVTGRFVTTLIDGQMPSGDHSIAWNGLDRNRAPAGSGLYVCRMRTSGLTQSIKLLLIR